MNDTIMNDFLDIASKILKKVTDILLLRHQVKTAFGVVLGTSFYFLKEFFKPLFNEGYWLQPNNVPLIGYIIIGIFFLHLRTIISLIFKKESFDENIEDALNIIENAEKKGIPKWQVRNLYLEVCQRVLQRIELEDSISQQIREFEKNF